MQKSYLAGIGHYPNPGGAFKRAGNPGSEYFGGGEYSGAIIFSVALFLTIFLFLTWNSAGLFLVAGARIGNKTYWENHVTRGIQEM